MNIQVESVNNNILELFIGLILAKEYFAIMFRSNSPSLKYLDPSGVWMGPPDKREPKVISNVFEFPHSNISFPATMDKTNTEIGTI